MPMAKDDLLGEIKSGLLSMLLLARVAELTRARDSKETSEATYTQGLFDYAQKKLGATSSTCYSRLRLLRWGGFLIEESGVRKGKGVVGYSITPEGTALLKELLKETGVILNQCLKISGEEDDRAL